MAGDCSITPYRVYQSSLAPSCVDVFTRTGVVLVPFLLLFLPRSLSLVKEYLSQDGNEALHHLA